MNWVLITGALWVVLAPLAALLIGQSIHQADGEQDAGVPVQARYGHHSWSPCGRRADGRPRSRVIDRCAHSERRTVSAHQFGRP